MQLEAFVSWDLFMSEFETKLVPGRFCGDCSACCVTLRIEEPNLKKLADVSCSKLLPEGGCGIYENRPGVCRSWYCGWRFMQQLDESWRPDRSKIIVRLGGVANGGLILQPLEKASELLTSEKVLEIVGGCVAGGVPIYISVQTKPDRCHALLHLNDPFKDAVASRNLQAVQIAMVKALEYAYQVATDPIVPINGEG